VPLPGLSARGLVTHKSIDQSHSEKIRLWSNVGQLRRWRHRETHEDYSNTRLGVDHQVDDLLGRMTLAEKAGMLFQTMIVVGWGDLAAPNSAFGVESAEHMINNQQLSHFNVVRAADDARALADWHNRLQRLARSAGVPGGGPSPGAASSD
jgi:hypothetical protein